MSVLGGLLEAILAAPFELGPRGSDRRRDRHLLSERRARCGIRAVTGRVLDMGSEWSVGICVISTGRIVFTPRFGIVGDRDVDVLEVLSSDSHFQPSPSESHDGVDLGLGDVVTYVIRTGRGDLLWALPVPVAEPASALLFSD